MRRLFAVLSICLLSACQTIQERPAAFQIGVTYAVQRYVWERPEDRREATKERIRAVAADLKALTSAEAVTLITLRQALDSRLEQADLIPPDRALITALADAIVLELQSRVSTGALDKDDVATVRMVLGWIEQAAA